MSSASLLNDILFLSFNQYGSNKLLASYVGALSSGQWSTSEIKRSTWKKQFQDGVHSIAVDQNSNIHLSMQINGVAYYVNDESGPWQYTSLDLTAEEKMSIVLDHQKKVHIGISENYRLYYATNSSGQWETILLPLKDFSSSFNKVPLAVDSNNNIHTVIAASDGVFHLESVDEQWEMTKIHSKGDVPQIAIDKNDTIHICFDGEGKNDNQIGYAKKEDNNWSLEFFDIEPDLGLLDDLAMTLDSHGNAYILFSSYFYESPLYLANHSSGEWEIEIIDYLPVQGSSILIDKDNYVHCFYYGPNSHKLYYTNNTSGTWENEEIKTTD